MSDGFGPGFNGPLIIAARTPDGPESLSVLAAALPSTARRGGGEPGDPERARRHRGHPSDPSSSPQSEATTDLTERLRDDVIPRAIRGTGATVSVGGITAGGSDVSELLSARLPLFIGGVLG